MPEKERFLDTGQLDRILARFDARKYDQGGGE